MKDKELISKLLSDDYYNSPKNRYDYIQIALDVYGSSVRDNTLDQLVRLGREYHEIGIEFKSEYIWD